MRAVKLLTVVYFIFTAFGLLLWRANERSQPSHIGVTSIERDALDAQTPQLWFNETRQHCNAAEVAAHVLSVPRPSSTAGMGYAAVCWATAGRVDDARGLIDVLPQASQPWAAQVLFVAIHSLADSGNEVAVAPAMELVLEYQPNNVMALYHAGSAAYATGRTDAAHGYLERFVALYGPDDGWKSNARVMLGVAGSR